MISHISHPQEAPEQRRSLRQTSAVSPTTVRKAVEDTKNAADLFSPTSAAALALSTLHHFGAQRDSRTSPADADLKGTRLFNKDSAATTTTTTTTLSARETAADIAYRSTSPPSGGSGYPFELSSQSYNNQNPGAINHMHHTQHTHSVTWGGVNPNAGYHYSYAQTGSRSSSARASPTYPDEQHSTYVSKREHKLKS